ncbi:MAG: tRNA 2-thiouridine(34) synthase MnmA [Endomicrobiales bacterium]|nr:tRNA 2-thiouridine(34) synthase MnmA [Endomicrobiales bacterium]
MKNRVLVAMSGGIDSSSAALMLKNKGYEVSGITFIIGSNKDSENIRNSKKVCRHIGIKHHVLDIKKDFRKLVIRRFVNEYISGITPNPCIFCNEEIKFGILLDAAKKMRFDYLATGHYARIKKSKDGCILQKGADPKKDQSYFLYRLSQGSLKNIIFPLGDSTKEKIKMFAHKHRLPVMKRPESQEICFIEKDYRSFLESYLNKNKMKAKPGIISDKEGNILGKHKGLFYYTIGQRSGLGISHKHPLHVLRIDVKNNKLIVGGREQLFTGSITVNKVTWIKDKAPQFPYKCRVKIRYLHKEVPAVLYKKKGRITAELKKPQMSATPGQSAVFYNGASVLGGGIIEH